MISDRNIKEMMDIYVSKGEAKTKELNSLGFQSGELTKLINESIIERIGRGSYKIKFDELFNYAKKLIEEEKFENAYSVLNRCHMDYQENLEVIYYLFLISVLLDKYDDSVNYIKKLLNDNSETIKTADVNFYFMLLGLSKKLSNELIDICKNIRYEDIQILTGDKNNDYDINVFRGKIFTGGFKNFEFPYKDNSLEFRVQSKLIQIIIQRQNDERDYMYDLVKYKKLNDLLQYLDNDLSYRNLNKVERYFKIILNSYFTMEKTLKLPTLKSLECSDIWQAIDNNNFRAALRLQREHCEKVGSIVNKSQMYLLLEEINEMIDAVKSLSDNKSLGISKVTSLNNSKNMSTSEVNSIKRSVGISLESIMEMLEKEDVNNACYMIDAYLKDTSEYSYIVKYLIKLSLYEKDKTYSKPMMAISMMKSNQFKLVLSDYILSFYECLGKKKFDEAGVYLDILDKLQEKGHAKIVIKGMREVLDSAILESKDKLKRPSYNYVSSTVSSKYSFEDLNVGYTYEEFYNRGIILIDFNKFNISEKLPILATLPNLDYFIIGYASNRKIVLKYKDYENVNSQEFIDKLLYEASQNFIEGKYESCFETYKVILKKSFVPNANLYYRLGEVSLKLNKKYLARDYFTVASSLSKIEDINKCFVFSMMGDKNVNSYEKDSILSECEKENLSDEERTRKEEIINYYGFDIDKVVYLVVNNNMSLLDACNKLGLWEEEYYRCALYLAREYYYLGDHKKGNLYFNLVNQSKKSKYIEEFYKQVKMNKNFYSKTELEGPRLRLK